MPGASNESGAKGRDGKSGALGVEDWIEAAKDLLVSENVRGVQVSTLCQRLKVTKGSFYWHFSSRDELLVAVVSDWRHRMTLNIVTRLKRAAADGLSTLRALLALPRRAFSVRGAAIETSMRDWGRREATAHQALKEVDLIRLNSFEQIFRGLGFPAREAKTRAYVAYAIMMGDSILKETLGSEISTDEFVDLSVELLASLPRDGGQSRDGGQTPRLQT